MGPTTTPLIINIHKGEKIAFLSFGIYHPIQKPRLIAYAVIAVSVGMLVLAVGWVA